MNAVSERNPSPDLLGALYALEDVNGFGPMKFREMHRAGVDPRDAARKPGLLPLKGKTGVKIQTGIGGLAPSDLAKFEEQAVEQLERARKCGARILTHFDPDYPSSVYDSNHPAPVLYLRGSHAARSRSEAVAIVGSRNTREPYATGGRKFARAAARLGFTVVSGFARGADAIGHAAARDGDGHTICVMPCGVDLLYPTENRSLWNQLLQYPGAAFVSEFRFGQRALPRTLAKRNKLIAAYSAGVMVVQSSKTGGAMHAYRFARSQGKPIATFRDDGTDDTTGNKEISEDLEANAETFDLTKGGNQFEGWLRTLPLPDATEQSFVEDRRPLPPL